MKIPPFHKYSHTILLFSFVLFVSSCSSSSYPHMSVPVSTGQQSGQENQPTFVTIDEQDALAMRRKDEPTVTPKPKKEVSEAKNEKGSESESVSNKAEVATTERFTAREMDHPSSSSYDPFGSSSSFSLDLNEAAKDFRYPVDGHLLSPYGPRGRGWHSGADIKGDQGDPIYAIFDGVVRLSKAYGAYGNVMVIRHSNGLESVYSHNERNLVKVGARVKAGQKIGTVGRTGNASGTHCHFEIRVQGQTIDPKLVLNFNNRTIQAGELVVKRNGSQGKVVAVRQGVGSPSQGISRPVPPAEYIASNDVPSSSGSGANSVAGSTIVTSTTAISDNSSSVPKIHTVVKGDTLSALARRYGTTVKKLCSLNGITERTILQLKQKLKVQ